MLSHQDNETLVRVGPGTAMGSLFRLYWIPFLALKGSGRGRPAEARDVAGRRSVAFRDSQQRVGLMANACAHRGAPMMFGRNEDCACAASITGWKFRRHRRGDGHAAEPGQEPVEGKGQDHRYPCRERNRHRLDLYGPADRRSAALAESRMEPGSAENVHFSMRIQESTGCRRWRRNRFRPCAILHSRHRLQGRDQQVAGDARSASDFECMRRMSA